MPVLPTGRGSETAEANRVDRVAVHGGAFQVDPPSVRAVTPPSRRVAESRGWLYVLISPAGPVQLPPELVQELMRVIGEAYYELSGTITRGLRSAMLAANELLFDRNLRQDPESRLIAGAVCAVLRGEDLYVAQMGPAVAIVSRGMDTHRYPDRSAWITSAQPVGLELDREPPLGLRRDVEPSLFHAAYRPEDMVILAGADLVREASDGELAAACLRTDRDDLTRALVELANGRDVALLLVRPARRVEPVQPIAPVITASTLGTRPDRGRVSPEVPVDELTIAMDGGRDLPLGPLDAAQSPASGRPAARKIRAEPSPKDASTANRPPAAPSWPEPDTESSDEAYSDALVEPDVAAWRPSARVHAGTGEATEEADVEIIHTKSSVDLRQFADTVADGARRLRDGTENVLLNVLPKEIPPRPIEPEPTRVPMSTRALVAVAMIIPLIVLFTVVMTRVQYDRQRAAQETNAVGQAQYLYDLAVREQDAQLKRDNLNRALAAIDQGLALVPDNADLQDLERRAQHQLDQLDGVIPIYAFARLYYFQDAPVSATDSSRIAINGKDVMVLNRGGDMVYHFTLNDVGDALQPVTADPVVARRGDVFDGVTVTDLVDLNYMESAGSQSLARFITLDRSGNLFSYDPNRGMRAQPVGNADLWLSPQAIGSYFGNLYVLDPLLGRLFKYLPTNNEYVKTPLDYFDAALGVDLTGAVDMAIDANVYLLFADGTIAKYNNGQRVDFGMRGFYGKMRSPVTIFVSGGQQEDAVGYVYVADAGNNRVLQFSKEGDYIRQFRAVESEPYMNNLRGLYVDEKERRMFLVSGQHLVLCTLPALTP